VSSSPSTLAIEQVAGKSAVVGAHAHTPLKWLSPKNHGHAAWVFQSTYGGGFVGDDALKLDIEVRPGASLFLSSQAASKVYRATQSRFTLEARVGPGATLVCWPDPVVCFAGARLVQRQSFQLEATASLVCVDACTAGRVASGERWAFDHLALKLEVAIDQAPCFTDALVLSPLHGELRARLSPFDAFSTVVLAGPKLAAACEAIEAQINAGPLQRADGRALVVCSRWPWGLVIRLAAGSMEALAQSTRALLQPLLPALLGDDPLERKW
jgi:urease accessory protein